MWTVAQGGIALTDDRAMGSLVFSSILGIAALLGVVAAIRSSRKASTQTWCALALASFLGLLSLSFLLGALRSLGVLRESLALTFPLGALALLLVAATPTLAIGGLIAYRRRADRVLRGRAQAIWALVLWVAFVGIGVAAVSSARSRSSESVRNESIPRGATRVSAFVSPAFGISLQPPDDGWWHEKNVRDLVPGAILGAVHGRGAGLVLLPLVLPEDVPVPDDSVLSRAVEDMVVASTVLARPPTVSPIEHRGAPGREMTFEASLAGRRYLHRLRIVRRGRIVHWMQGWVLKGRNRNDDLVSRTLDAVRLAPPSFSPSGSTHREGTGAATASLLSHLSASARTEGHTEDEVAYATAAAQADPSNEEFLLNAFQRLDRLERYEAGSRLFLEHLQVATPSLSARSWGPYFDQMRGARDRALSGYDALFRAGHDDEDDLKLYVALLIDMERLPEADGVLRRFVAHHDSTRARRWLGQVQSQAGEHEAAVATFGALRDADPENPAYSFELVRALYQAERYGEALAAAEAAIARGLRSAELSQYQGMSAFALDRYAEAKAAFEAGLAMDASNEGLRDLLRQASVRLGEGDNSSLKSPIPAVRVPDGVLDRISTVLDAYEPPPDSEALWHRSRVVATEFRPGEVLRTTTYLDYCVVDPAAAPGASSLLFSLDTATEQAYVNQLEVLDGEGAVLARGDPSSYFLQLEEGTGGASNWRRLVLPVPGLQPGCRVRAAVTLESRSPPSDFPFERFEFVTLAPTAVRARVLVGDVASIRHRAVGDLEETIAEDSLSWVLPEPPRVVDEPFPVPRSTYVPCLWAGATTASWKGIARGYLSDVADRLVLADAIPRLAEDLTQGLATRREKITAVARHVQKAYVYKSIAFGPRARVPEPVQSTLERGWGDCKDHALVLHQLLSSLGIESHLALMHTAEPVQRDFPSAAQFDHMLVYLPVEDLFLDATDKYSDVMAPTPLFLADRKALVLDPVRPRLVSIPAFTSAASTMDCVRQVELRVADQAGDARVAHVTESVTLTGVLAGIWRGALRTRTVDQREDALREVVQASGPVQWMESRVEGLDECERPLVIHTTYEAPAAFRSTDAAIVGGIPISWERWALHAEPAEPRRAPFRTPYPMTLDTRTRVLVPPDHEVRAPRAEQDEGASDYGSWASRWSVEHGLVEVHYRHETLEVRHEAGQYQAFCSFRRDALKPLARTIFLERE